MTEDARQGVGAVAFNGLDLGVDGPGSGVLRNLSGFSGRATSRLWKVDIDFVQHYLQEPDSPIRGRFFIGPQFIGLKETYGFTAQGATGDAVYDSRTVNTLFGGDIGGGISSSRGIRISESTSRADMGPLETSSTSATTSARPAARSSAVATTERADSRRPANSTSKRRSGSPATSA